MSTVSSSDPAMIFNGYGTAMPRMFLAATTYNSSEVSAVGFWVGYGAGSRGSNPVGMRIGDVLMHIASTGSTGSAGHVTMHQVVGSTANVASTSASSGFNASYNVSVSAAP